MSNARSLAGSLQLLFHQPTVLMRTLDVPQLRMMVPLLLGLFATAIFTEAAHFRDCGSKVGHFTEVTVSGCEESKPTCDLKKNTNATIEITFDNDKDVSHIEAVVHGILMDIPLPFPIPNGDVCKDTESGISCPLAKGGPYKYKTSLEVRSTYPKVQVLVRWELRDQNNQDIVCVEIPARIV